MSRFDDYEFGGPSEADQLADKAVRTMIDFEDTSKPWGERQQLVREMEALRASLNIILATNSPKEWLFGELTKRIEEGNGNASLQGSKMPKTRKRVTGEDGKRVNRKYLH